MREMMEVSALKDLAAATTRGKIFGDLVRSAQKDWEKGAVQWNFEFALRDAKL